jgi:hypothetical protein
MDPDKTARMRMLVWINAGCKRTMLVLSWRGSNMLYMKLFFISKLFITFNCFLYMYNSLGCEHDGDNNACADGYVMAPKLSMTSTRKWTFSSCSVQYIRNFITKLNRFILTVFYESVLVHI